MYQRANFAFWTWLSPNVGRNPLDAREFFFKLFQLENERTWPLRIRENDNLVARSGKSNVKQASLLFDTARERWKY